jgi:hypothetical protein
MSTRRCIILIVPYGGRVGRAVVTSTGDKSNAVKFDELVREVYHATCISTCAGLTVRHVDQVGLGLAHGKNGTDEGRTSFHSAYTQYR